MGFSEAKAMRIALATWAEGFANYHLHAYVDNEGLYHLLNGSKLSSPDARLQNELVEIALILMAFSIKLTVHWWASGDNTRADLASRVHHPASGPADKEKLDRTMAEWRRDNVPWQWKHQSPAASVAERQSAVAGKQLLDEWRRQAAEL